MRPRVSILLPTYNGARFIARAVENAKKQTFRDFELLVIDDGSTDATPEIIKKLSQRDVRIRYIRNEKNLGIQRALNRGLREALGEYIARLDDDDVWLDEEKLKSQVEFLDSHPDYVLLGTGAIVVDEAGQELFRFLGPETDERIRNAILRKNCFTHSTVMFRRGVVMALGGYAEDERSRHVEDYDLWLRLGAQGLLANLPRFAIQSTLRLKNVSWQNKLAQLRKDIELVKRYRHAYPRSRSSLAFALIRYALYRAFPFFPFKKTVLKLYKTY